MAGFITMAQAIMGATGGVPVQPAGAKTIIEKLRAAKSMMPGDMGGMLSKIMKDGPGAILQNPMAGLQDIMGGQIGSIVGKVAGMSEGGMGGLLNSLTGAGGLTQALGKFLGATNMLSGLSSPGAGQFGLMDAIGHTNVTSMLGSALPAELSINTAMAPILMDQAMSTMNARLATVERGITSGSMGEDMAIATVNGITSELTNAVDASNNAFATVQGRVVEIAQFSALVSMIASGPDELKVIANLLIQDQHKAEIQEAMDEQIRR
ncbi:hypothetical protein [Methylobacterium sp. WL120]|uniref:hypothetical protein n=1 Tax=Methylobacterium sp. WL120 TaxID=2603887 RepID=UPI0011C7BE2F|nr:hypothetical protein [Methylobacterium sp. WL120]TXM68199.1 hypothetical protein FV229_08520 [Methylobacterium sp. WL120]